MKLCVGTAAAYVSCMLKTVFTLLHAAFVMDAWGKSVGAGDKVLMLADGNAQFTKVGVDEHSTCCVSN